MSASPLTPSFSGVAELARLQDREVKLLALLERIENAADWCVICQSNLLTGNHAPDCELDAALKEAP